jgi:hypothetical protein
MKKHINYFIPAMLFMIAAFFGCSKSGSNPVNPTVTKSLVADSVIIYAGKTDQFNITNGPLATALFDNPWGMTFDQSGNIYVADYYNYIIRKITPAGIVSTVAGNGVKGFVDGPAAQAEFFAIQYLAADAAGNIYEIQPNFPGDPTNGALRKVSNGVVSTISTGTYKGVTADVKGNIYVSTPYQILKVNSSGGLTVFAGGSASGTADGTGTSASFSSLGTLTADPNGNIIAFDNGNIRIINATTAKVTTVTVKGSNVFEVPTGIAADQWDNVYVANEGTGVDNGFILKIAPDGTVSNFAGIKSGANSFHGAPLSTEISLPQDIVVLPSGNILVSSGQDAIIQEIITHQQQ